MDNILLCTNYLPTFTSIHNTFIEKYMLGANGSYVKVYLYLAKCIQAGEENLSISSLADKMENTEKDVIRALHYWEKKGLLHISRKEDKTIQGIDMLNPDEMAEKKAEEEKPDIAMPAAKPSASVLVDISAPPLRKAAAPHKQQPFRVNAEQTRRLAKDSDFCWICQMVESYLERPVKPAEMQLLSYLYDNLHFSSDLILYLYEYCISLGKTSTSYIQSVAVAWDEKKVTTPEEAANASSSYNACYNAISKAFALGRSLAAVERSFVDRWKNEWNMDLSVILEACNRTMLKIQKADFKYTEGILDNWHKANIHTLQDVEKADEVYAKNKAAHQQNKKQGSTAQPRNKGTYSSYMQHDLSPTDMDLLEKQLLNIK